jgi:hypothetical protein
VSRSSTSNTPADSRAITAASRVAKESKAASSSRSAAISSSQVRGESASTGWAVSSPRLTASVAWLTALAHLPAATSVYGSRLNAYRVITMTPVLRACVSSRS